jgi:outer membrane protein assembly factor BamB
MVYVANSYDWQAMLAIRLEGARGDITGTDQVVWRLNRLTPYVPSPLLYGDRLYFLRHNQGILSCLKAKTGEPVYEPIRLEGIWMVFASPVGAAGRIYITDREGTTVVLKHGPSPEVLARNRLEDSFSASPAVVGDELYLRGKNRLYCVGQRR